MSQKPISNSVQTPDSVASADSIAGGVFSNKRTPLSVPSGARLQSFRSERDLTLGGSAPPKRLFKPKIPIRKKLEMPTAATQDEAGGSKEGASPHTKSNRREKETRKRSKRVTETTDGIFSAGPRTASRRTDSRIRDSIGGGGGGGGSSGDSSQKRGRLTVGEKNEDGIDGRNSFSTAYAMDIDADADVDVDDDDCLHDFLVPVQLPLLSSRRRLEKGDMKVGEEGEKSDDVRIKEEPNDENNTVKACAEKIDLATQTVVPPTPIVKKRLHPGDLFSVEESSRKRDIFFQFPHALPNETVAEDDNTFKTLSSGRVGKLAVHKFGRIELKMGGSGVSFDLGMGSSCGFLQEISSIDEDEQRSSHLTTFGQTSHRVVCMPRLHSRTDATQ